jgi:hypothetical protein
LLLRLLLLGARRALVGPTLPAIAGCIARRDEAGLARELADIKSMY